MSFCAERNAVIKFMTQIDTSPAQCVGDTRPGMQAEALNATCCYFVDLHFAVAFCALVVQTGFGAGTAAAPVPVILTLEPSRIDALTVIVAVIVCPLSAFFTLYVIVQVAVFPGLMVAGRQDGSPAAVPLNEYVNFRWLNVDEPVFLTVKVNVMVD